MIWSVTLAILIFATWLHWRYKNRRMLIMAKKLPGPPALPVVGNAIKFMVQPEEFIRVLRDLLNEYGDVVRIWLGTDLNIITNNPDDVRILLSNNKTSVKGPQYKYMVDVLGGGILSGSGAIWRKHRKIASPNYGKRAIECYNDIFNQEVELLVQRYKSLPPGQLIDIYKHIVQSTSYTVCQTLMGLSREECLELPHLQTLIDVSPSMYDIVFDRMTKWYLQIDPIFWFTKGYRIQKENLNRIHEFSRSIIKHRMNKLANMEENKLELLNSEEDSMNSTKLSVIDRFILSNELNPQEIIDETFTIFTSSQEATAKISSFTLLMMAYHPECQEKLYEEIVKIIGSKARPLSDDDLKKMPYLDMAFKEVIRLFPIGGMLQRTITEDIEISSCTLPAGSSLVVPLYHMHRDPRYWPDPNAFDPERFTPENIKKRNPYCYIPFSLGPMDCIGRYFAVKLVKTIVVRILQEFKLTTIGSYKDLRIAIAVSATTLDGFPAILVPRNKC